MQTKPVALLNLKWTKKLSLLLVLALFVGCSPTKSRTTFSSSDPEKISEHQRNEVRKARETCRVLIDNLEAQEPEKNIDYALLLNKADSFSNKIEPIFELLYQPYRPGDPDEFPQTLVENIYDSLRVFENFTRQSLCPAESSENYFNLDTAKVHEMLGSRGAARAMVLTTMQRKVYYMLATNLGCKLNK